MSESASPASRHVAAGFELHRTGDFEGAARSYEAALAAVPDHGDARYLLALVEMGRGRFENAREHVAVAVRVDPANAHYLFAAGEIARELNDRDGAIGAFEAAIAIDGTDAQRWAQLGDLHLAAGRPKTAERHARKAIELDRTLQNAWHLLGESLRAQARSTEAVDCYREAVRLAGAYGPAAESLVMTLNFSDAIAPAEVAAEHRRIGALLGPWGVRGEADAPWQVDRSALAGERPMRVGYVSADFGMHVVSFFIEPVLAAHDRKAVEVFCYFAAPHDDARSGEVKAHAAHWRSLVGLDDRAAAQLMRADRPRCRGGSFRPHPRTPPRRVRAPRRTGPGDLAGLPEHDRRAGRRLSAHRSVVRPAGHHGSVPHRTPVAAREGLPRLSATARSAAGHGLARARGRPHHLRMLQQSAEDLRHVPAPVGSPARIRSPVRA